MPLFQEVDSIRADICGVGGFCVVFQHWSFQEPIDMRTVTRVLCRREPAPVEVVSKESSIPSRDVNLQRMRGEVHRDVNVVLRSQCSIM